MASLEKAYAEALRIESAGLDPEDAKQREALEKVGDQGQGERAAIPTWAYYAVGWPRRLLPGCSAARVSASRRNREASRMTTCHVLRLSYRAAVA